MKPSFLITIDTEGDNLWSKPRTFTTHNSRFLPRFQLLCERFGFKPTYLTCSEMAECAVFQEFGRTVLRQHSAEIGMHLHAWNSLPAKALTEDDLFHQPYLTDFPEDVIEEKVVDMTARLERHFEVKVLSHRAGRWGFNPTYARVLARHGYRVDCSVVPHVSYRHELGDPRGTGGPDFRGFPSQPYFLDLADIRKAGSSQLLEVPMTVLSVHPVADRLLSTFGYRSILRRAFHRVFKGIRWLRPDGTNLPEMLGIVDEAVARGWPYVEFMLHSSEFMPAGSPNFTTEESIEKLYRDLEALFEYAARHFAGATLSEFRQQFKAALPPAAVAARSA